LNYRVSNLTNVLELLFAQIVIQSTIDIVENHSLIFILTVQNYSLVGQRRKMIKRKIGNDRKVKVLSQ
jgi:hypothetical protein